ncbi:MAG: replication initiator protein [Microviridae sp.]|nr:MAG: replication initiator protein [Microviridae sp.]
MQCTSPGQMRHPKTRLWLPYPCGQCLNCRIKKQSSWTLRNLMEFRTAHSGQYWTLTLDEPSMPTLDATGPKKMMRTFFNRLRHSEAQANNPNQIRYYGCYEHGDLSDRPHFHLLLYNMQKNLLQQTTNNTSWAGQHTKLWPHGHVDVGHITPASVRYVSDYMMKFSPKDTEPSSIPFRTRRPAIGYYGILHTLLRHAGPKYELQSKPAYFQINGRKYPLDNWTRKTWEKLRKKYKIKYREVLEPIDRKLEALAFELAKDEHYYHLEFLRNRELKSRMELAHGKKEAKRLSFQLRKTLLSSKPS